MRFSASSFNAEFIEMGLISCGCFVVVSRHVLRSCDGRSVNRSVSWCFQAGHGRRSLESGQLSLPFLIEGLGLRFIHVLEVLVELLLAGFPVLFPLDDVASVLDVMADGHLLQSAVRVLQTPPSLLYSSRSTARLRRGLEDFRGLVSLFRVRHDRRRGKRVAVGV